MVSSIMKNVGNFPLALKIVAGYLIIIGTLNLVWPFLGLEPVHVEFIAKSHFYKIGVYSRSIILDFLFLASGIGILFRKNWARKTAMAVLVVSTIYAANSYAWGFAGAQPTRIIFLGSLALVTLWNGLWFFLVYRYNFDSTDKLGCDK